MLVVTSPYARDAGRIGRSTRPAGGITHASPPRPASSGRIRLSVLCTATRKVPSNAVQAPPRNLVVSLDIGTHGSGFAHAKPAADGKGAAGPQQVLMHEAWPDQPVKYAKTRSALLYDQSRRVQAWGWSAPKRFLSLDSDEQQTHSLQAYFKIALEDESFAQSMKKHGLTPEQVMTDYLREFCAYVKQQLRRQGASQADIDTALWCMSVPTLWDDAQKDIMRTAAYRAGITRERYDESLQLLLEPEAAALHAVLSGAAKITPGMTVGVLDMGAGTVDLSVHLVDQRGPLPVLSDLVHGRGYALGSAYIDQELRTLCQERLGKATFLRWAEQHPQEDLTLDDRWMTVKHTWDGTCDNKTTHRVPLPPSLQAMLDPSDRAALAKTQGGHTTDLLLTGLDIKSLFDTSVEPILEDVANHLQQEKATCNQLILSGGFASSRYVQTRLRDVLVRDTKLVGEVVTPPFPHAAVMQGTALYGCHPELIRARRTRMSYGIRQAAPYTQGAPGKFFNEEEGCFWTDSVYAKMVDRGQEVPVDEEVSHYVTPLHHTQTEARIQLYATDNNETRFVLGEDADPDMLCLGELVLTLPQMQADQPLPTLCVRLMFGKAELQATAMDVATGQKREVKLKFKPAS